MTSAQRLFRLTVALGFVAVGAIITALVLAVEAVDLHPGMSGVYPASLFMLAVLAVGVVVTARAVLALRREINASRRMLRALPRPRTRRHAGVQFEVFEHRSAQAFCAGFLRPRIYVSSGTVAMLTAEELRAVLVHERHHLGRRDPLRLLLLRVLGDGLWCVPGLRRTGERYGALAELAADEAALGETHDSPSLARALLIFGEAGSPAGAVGIAPERVDHLLGARPAWELPAGVLVAFGLAVAALAGSVILAQGALSGQRVDLPAELAGGLCGVALALGALWRRR